jgi:hypothetical protein
LGQQPHQQPPQHQQQLGQHQHQQQRQPGPQVQPVPLSRRTAAGLQGLAAADDDAALLAMPTPLQHGVCSTLTVKKAAATGSDLRKALRRWAWACGCPATCVDADSTHVADLLPHYASLLSQLDHQHSSNQCTATTVLL